MGSDKTEKRWADFTHLPSNRKFHQMGARTQTQCGNVVPWQTASHGAHQTAEHLNLPAGLAEMPIYTRQMSLSHIRTLIVEQFHKVKPLHLIQSPVISTSSTVMVKHKRQRDKDPLYVLVVMLADQSLKDCFWGKKEIHRRNGNLINRKTLIPSISTEVQIREKTANGISKVANSSIMLISSVSCHSCWLLKLCSSSCCFSSVDFMITESPDCRDKKKNQHTEKICF